MTHQMLMGLLSEAPVLLALSSLHADSSDENLFTDLGDLNPVMLHLRG